MFTNQIIHGDCFEVLKTLDSESADLVITDPPYFVRYRDLLGRTLPRNQLLPFLGLKGMWNQRVDWLAEDVYSYFPFHWRTVTPPRKVYATLYLSRRRLPPEATEGRMTDEGRVTLMSTKGLSSGMITIPKESVLVEKIARLSHGIEGVQSPMIPTRCFRAITVRSAPTGASSLHIEYP